MLRIKPVFTWFLSSEPARRIESLRGSSPGSHPIPSLHANGVSMLDIVYLVGGGLFFAVCVVYATACDKL
jgi:hypothetical protein